MQDHDECFRFWEAIQAGSIPVFVPRRVGLVKVGQVLASPQFLSMTLASLFDNGELAKRRLIPWLFCARHEKKKCRYGNVNRWLAIEKSLARRVLSALMR